MATCSDGVLIIFLVGMSLSSRIKFAIYGIPSFLLSIQLFFMELKILKFIDHGLVHYHFFSALFRGYVSCFLC